MLTIFGLGVLGVLGTGVAAKLGLVNITKDVDILGQNVHVEFTQDKPIKFEVD